MLFNSDLALKSEKYSSKTLQFAFDELCKYLDLRFDIKTSGSKGTEVDFVVSNMTGYSVKISGSKILFEAGSEIEILYAVYSFAEKILGFSFFMPGEDRLIQSGALDIAEGEVIRVGEPLMKNRGFIQEFPFSEDSFKIADWMVKNRLNYLLTWMKYYDEITEELKEFHAARGIIIESGHHSFDYWMPTQKYYNDHPEYYAIINGERISPEKDANGYLQGGQLCVTNEGMRSQLVENMVAYCKAHPEIKIITLIPNDGFGWCECEECSKYYDKSRKGELFSLSEHVYEAEKLYHSFFEDISRRVTAVLPDITITLCAYVNYVYPADGFRLKKGTAVHLAPYWRCVNHLINDDNCPTNSGYKKAIEKWIKAKDGGQINIYEYYMGVNLYISLPLVLNYMIFDEVEYYHESGVDGILTQFHLPHWIAYGMNYYMMAKAMYGEDKGSVEEAYGRIFGENKSLAEEFYAQLENLTKSTGPCHITYPRSLLKRTDAEDYRKILDIAGKLFSKCPEDKIYKGIKIWAEYLLRFKELFDRYNNGENVSADIDGLYQWILDNKDLNVFVIDKVKMLFGRWKERISQGKPWYHYNLDWEDNYIMNHDVLLNKCEIQ